MRNFLLLPFILLWIGCTTSENPFPTEEINVKGLQQSVEIFRDQWGVNHIYAQNQNDLFFAQGYAAAQDRLFQFEVWRRQATGTVAEILGPEEIKRDVGTRLFQFRGDLDEELNHYHPQGKAIIEALLSTLATI
jgi:penicillin G amidase